MLDQRHNFPKPFLKIYITGSAYFWKAASNVTDRLQAIFPPKYSLWGVYWAAPDEVWLADHGGPRFYPNIYKLKLEGF